MSRISSTERTRPGQIDATAQLQNRNDARPILIQLVDACLLSTLAITPFALGGWNPVGQLILVSLVGSAAFAWFLHQFLTVDNQWVFSKAYFVLLAAVALVVLQTVALPQELINRLSPNLVTILPMWQAGENGSQILGTWSTLSLTPAATRTSLITLVTYVLFFAVTVNRIRSIDDVNRFLQWIAGISAIIAVFGLFQYLTSNGKFFWVLQMPQAVTDDVPKGPFTNRNHFAHLLALGAAPLLVYVVGLLNQRTPEFSRNQTPDFRNDLWIGLGISALATVIFALLFSLSRGGTVAVMVSVSLCMMLLYWKRQIDGPVAAAVATAGILAGGYLTIHGYEKIAARMDDWESTGRSEIWAANAKVVSEFPIFGTGVGSHQFAYQRHWDHPEFKNICTHAESSLMQIASECGLAGLSIAVIGVLFCFGWCVQAMRCGSDSRLLLAATAVSSSLAASAFHSVFDVVWHMPGLAVFVVVLAACACRLSSFATNSTDLAHDRTVETNVWGFRLCAGLTSVAVLLAGGWAVQRTIPRVLAMQYHHEYQMLAIFPGNEETKDEHPVETLEKRMALLEKAVELVPENSEWQRHLAFHFLSLFEIRQADNQNPMSVSQIRDAVIASQFPTTESMHNWLDRAIGDNAQLLYRTLEHAKRALALCPLHSTAYVQLSEIGFLENPGNVESQQFLQQALLVQPNNSYAHFIAGRDLWLAGDFESAIAHWKESFRQSKHYRKRIIDLMSSNLSAEFLLANFDFDWETLVQLKNHYKKLKNPHELATVLAAHARAAVKHAQQTSGMDSAPYWLEAFGSFVLLKRPDLAERSLKEAYKKAPYSFEVRLEYGKWLFDQERYVEAAEHLSWCTRRRPSDSELVQLAEAAVKAKIQFADTQTESTLDSSALR